MNRQTKPLKPYHGLIVLILTAVCIFLIGPVLSNYMGLYGTLISELLMLAGAVGCTFLFRGNPKYVFPIHKPTPHGPVWYFSLLDGNNRDRYGLYRSACMFLPG